MLYLANIFAKYNKGAESYDLTTLSKALIIALMLVALFVAAYFIGKRDIKISTKQLTVSAVFIALAFVASNMKLFKMPTGGSITLFSMMFICLIGYWYGIGAGILAGVTYGLLQLIVDPYIVTLPQLLTDYPLAFGALGLSGIGHHIDKKTESSVFEFGGLQIGYILGVLGRYAFSVISGVVFFADWAPKGQSPLVYSLTYNISYLGVEGIITLILISLAPVSQAIRLAGRIVASREDKEDKKKSKLQATIGCIILFVVLVVGLAIANL
jgi:thiamine transporter